MKYKNWIITENPKSIATRDFDVDFFHEDFDGAPDSDDSRCGAAATVEDAKRQIDYFEAYLAGDKCA